MDYRDALSLKQMRLRYKLALAFGVTALLGVVPLVLGLSWLRAQRSMLMDWATTYSFTDSAQYQAAIAELDRGFIGLVAFCVIIIVFAAAFSIYFIRRVALPLGSLSRAFVVFAEGDISQDVPTFDTGDEVGRLAQACNTMVHSFRDIIGQVMQSAEHVAATSHQLSSAADGVHKSAMHITETIEEMAKGAFDQTRVASETSASMSQLSKAIEQIAAGAQDQARSVDESSTLSSEMIAAMKEMSKSVEALSSSARATVSAAEKGAAAVDRAVEGMERIRNTVLTSADRVRELGKHSSKIGEIISVIDDISSQTDLLALNAAIEAARAGEAGRGFAVVADEVRRLAERSSTATKEIAELISNMQNGTDLAVSAMEAGTREVEQGSELAAAAGGALREILETIRHTNDEFSQIAAASARMESAVKEVESSIENIASITEENTAATEEMSAGSAQVVESISAIAAVSDKSAGMADQVWEAADQMKNAIQEMAQSAQSLSQMAEELRTLIDKFSL